MEDTGGTGNKEKLIPVGRGYNIGDRILHTMHGPGVIIDSYDGQRAVLAKFDSDTRGGNQIALFKDISNLTAGTGESGGKRRKRRKTRKTKSKKSTRPGRNQI